MKFQLYGTGKAGLANSADVNISRVPAVEAAPPEKAPGTPALMFMTLPGDPHWATGTGDQSSYLY